MGSEALLSERFQVVSRLGEGAYGTVYEATDRLRGELVAVKVLHRISAEAVFRFKREFRSLRDLRHPNLVQLGELIEREGQWLFSMELVRGADVLAYVRPRRVAVATQEEERRGRGFDEARLRDALGHRVVGVQRQGHPVRVAVQREALVGQAPSRPITSAVQTSKSKPAGYGSEAPTPRGSRKTTRQLRSR